MSWRTRDLMSLKIELLEKILDPDTNVSAICLKFGISRKTAYKWLSRYQKDRLQGLEELSRRPLRSPSRISEEMVLRILAIREKEHCGGKKIRKYLEREGVQDLPSVATCNRVLLRCGRIDVQESEKRERYIRFERERPNELWQMDFKGHFKLCETGRCHPLTILDDHSRFSICIKACASENEKSVRQGLENAFRQYGLPEGMTMDNGTPWRGGQTHLSRITVWLMRLGIKVSHSTPGHPQTQGKIERFHRSLKEEVLKYHQFSDLENAQTRFDEWRDRYNNHRPHEGIGLLCPKDRYKPSDRVYPDKLPEIPYEEGDEPKRVNECGGISIRGEHYHVGEHFASEYVALRRVEEGIFDVYFCKTKIRRVNLRK